MSLRCAFTPHWHSCDHFAVETTPFRMCSWYSALPRASTYGTTLYQGKQNLETANEKSCPASRPTCAAGRAQGPHHRCCNRGFPRQGLRQHEHARDSDARKSLEARSLRQLPQQAGFAPNVHLEPCAAHAPCY